MNDFFDVTKLDLLTEDEKEFNKQYVNKLIKYSEGGKGVDGVQMKALTAGASVIAKRQQSRSAVAVLKFGIQKHSERRLIEGRKENKD